MRNVLYRIFVGVAIVLLALAVLTILPWPGASTPCMLGYRALCSAAPISTFILIVIAGTVYIWANYALRGRKTL